MKAQATNPSDALPGAAPSTRLVDRIASMDAYRGLVMLLMMGEHRGVVLPSPSD